MQGNMDGSRINGRAPWKQSVIKNNTIQSRIYGENKELPNKFSPARFTNTIGTSKSLIKYKSSTYSQDEINMGQSRDRSLSKQAILGIKQGVKTLRSNEGDIIVSPRKKSKTENSLDIDPIKIPAKGEIFQNGDVQIVRQLKMEFFRFKQKILKQLKKQEEYLKQSVNQIYMALDTVNKAQTQPAISKQKKEFEQTYSSPINTIKLQNTISPKMNIYQEKLFKDIDFSSKYMPQPVRIDTSKYKKQEKYQKINGQENVLSLIREKLNTFSELVSILKKDINDKTINFASHLPICME